MLASLRLRFLVALMGVVLVAVGTQAVLVSQSTKSAFTRYVDVNVARDQMVASTLLKAPSDLADTGKIQATLQQLSVNGDARFVAADGSGVVIADSSGGLVGKPLGATGGAAVAPLPDPALGPFAAAPDPGAPLSYSAGVKIGQPFIAPAGTLPSKPAGAVPVFLFVAPDGAGETAPPGKSIVVARVMGTSGPNESNFLGSINQSLLVTGGATGLAALLLALLLARGVVGPVETLTLAARRMEKGDLSGRVTVRAHGEIGELAHAFNAMADGLGRLERVRRSMVTDIAHELRTPLANIRGYLEALRDGVVAPTPALLDSLHEEALLLTRLVADLQELELAEAGQLRLARRPVAVGDLVAKAVQAVQPTAAAKGVAVAAAPLPDLPALQADPDRLGQVLRNLLCNAITHTPAGGAVTVTAGATAGGIELRVSDTGSGIAADQLPHIFDRFYRGDPSRARSTGGAGLGLAIVQALVAAHGGTVRAASPGPGGRGSTFTVTLPVGRPPPC